MGEKGGGEFGGEGERTTETVSHTVPNMAAADQFPPSIDWPEHPTHTNKNTFLFLVMQRTYEENNNRLKLARPTLLTVLISTRRGGEPGSKAEDWSMYAGTRAQGVRMPDPCGPCAPRC